MQLTKSLPGRSHRVLLGLLTLLLTSLLIFVGYKVSLARNKAAIFAADRIRMTAYNASLDTPEANDAYIAKAKILREEWRTWAMAHKAELKKMLASKPTDKAAFQAVFDAIPHLPTKANCGIGLDEVSMNALLPFTWNAILKRPSDLSNVADPVTREKTKQGEATRFYVVNHEFERLHDIELTESVKTGAHQVHLWVSGRLTQEVQIEQRDAHGSQMVPTSFDICPPYEELQ